MKHRKFQISSGGTRGITLEKNIGARMLLPYERVQRVNKNTPGHTIIYFTQLWDFCTDSSFKKYFNEIFHYFDDYMRRTQTRDGGQNQTFFQVWIIHVLNTYNSKIQVIVFIRQVGVLSCRAIEINVTRTKQREKTCSSTELYQGLSTPQQK